MEISEIWGLQPELDNKARLEHGHHIRSIDGLKEGLDGKADENHDHPIATDEAPGFMSTADRIKLDGLSNGGGGEIFISSVDGLSDALNGKAPSSHTHAIAQVAGLQTALDSKVSVGAVTDLLTGLQTAIDGKAAAGHTHAIGAVTGLQTALDGKAATGHAHSTATTSADGFMSAADKAKLDSLSSSGGGASTIAQVTGLQTALDGKAASSHTHAGLPNLSPAELTYTASQSSTYGTTPAGTYASLTDGSFTTGTGTSSEATAWIKADLGSVKAISQIWLGGGTIPGGWGNAAGYLNAATLEVSFDDSNWAIALLSLAQISDTAVTKFAFGGLLARYVRIKRSGYIGAGEFRIFG
jgi:Phage tail repeat like